VATKFRKPLLFKNDDGILHKKIDYYAVGCHRTVLFEWRWMNNRGEGEKMKMGRSLMSCKDVSSLISLGQDQRLSLRERMMVRVHLFFCEACSRFSTQIRFLDKAAAKSMREKPESENKDAALSEEARQRIVRAMDKEEGK